MTPQPFGCPSCFQGDAEAMWNAISSFRQIAPPVEESHFSVRILACPRCGQKCLKVFTEIIDWSGGDDSMYSSFLPLI